MIEKAEIIDFFAITLLSLLLKEVYKKTNFSYTFLRIAFWVIIGYFGCGFKSKYMVNLSLDLLEIERLIEFGTPIIFTAIAFNIDWISFEVNFKYIFGFILVSLFYAYFCSYFILSFEICYIAVLCASVKHPNENIRAISLTKSVIMFSFNSSLLGDFEFISIISKMFNGSILGIILAVIVNKWTFRILSDKFLKEVVLFSTVALQFYMSDYYLIEINFYIFALSFSYITHLLGDNYLSNNSSSKIEERFFTRISFIVENFIFFALGCYFGRNIFEDFSILKSYFIPCIKLYSSWILFRFATKRLIIYYMVQIRKNNVSKLVEYFEIVDGNPYILMLTYWGTERENLKNFIIYFSFICFMLNPLMKLFLTNNREKRNVGINEKLKRESKISLKNKIETVIKGIQRESDNKMCDWKYIIDFFTSILIQKDLKTNEISKTKGDIELEDKSKDSLITTPLNITFMQNSDILFEMRLKIINFLEFQILKDFKSSLISKTCYRILKEVCLDSKYKCIEKLNLWLICFSLLKKWNFIKYAETLKEFSFIGKFAKQYINQKLFYSFEVSQSFYTNIATIKSELNLISIKPAIKDILDLDLSKELEHCLNYKYQLSQSFPQLIKNASTFKCLTVLRAKVKDLIKNEYHRSGLDKSEKYSLCKELDRKYFNSMNKQENESVPNFFSFVFDYPLFSHLSNEDLKLIFESMHEIEYFKGDNIWSKGNTIDKCLMIKTGIAQQYFGTKEVIHNLGDFVGLHSLFVKENLSISTLFAEETLKCITFPLALMKSISSKNKEFRHTILQMHSHYLVYYYTKKCPKLSNLDESRLLSKFMNSEIVELSKMIQISIPKGGFLIQGNIETYIPKEDFLKKSKYYFDIGSELPETEDYYFTESNALLMKFN